MMGFELTPHAAYGWSSTGEPSRQHMAVPKFRATQWCVCGGSVLGVIVPSLQDVTGERKGSVFTVMFRGILDCFFRPYTPTLEVGRGVVY